MIRYDDDTGKPFVLYAVAHRWKGNYWRDVTDLDIRDIPGPVKEKVLEVLPVHSIEDLINGERLIDEGGESRFQKYHKPRIEEMDGEEMWGLSYLKDALKDIDSAVESFEDGSKAEELTKKLHSSLKKVITLVEP